MLVDNVYKGSAILYQPLRVACRENIRSTSRDLSVCLASDKWIISSSGFVNPSITLLHVLQLKAALYLTFYMLTLSKFHTALYLPLHTKYWRLRKTKRLQLFGEINGILCEHYTKHCVCKVQRFLMLQYVVQCEISTIL